MITGLEIPIITALSGKLAAAIQANRTSVLVEETKSILNDEKLTNLLCLLYKLDPKLAKRNDKQYRKARAICDNLDLLKGSRYILIRHISARSANALALQYSDRVTAETTDAKIKQSREKAHMREQMEHSDGNKHISHAPHSVQHRHAAAANTNQKPRYIVQTPSMAAFAYHPQDTPDNSTIESCPKGAGPILPDGFKHGTLAYYYQSQLTQSAITKNENSSTSQTDSEEDDLVPVIEIRDKPESSRRGSAQRFPRGHVRRRSTDSSEEIVENIRSGLQDIAETAHYIDHFRASNESNDDVSSITSGTSHMSFDDSDTEGGGIFDSGLDDF
ncbi:hypothetical protein F5876DRAFT_79745 [Lentinula aff. lateritia]|uniref:Uncharacterized protein n=1 Tax=Lentinula aff. lateritia TaxID=2804960 RepID=A0ACC1TS24_9AGAR|nr:hypothetical protein F5876DRAFT_79745 [Lentinula aff. lateritia]